ncbi:MAG: MBL fold metallo-hydrolase [Lachnospiraceae bacterium]|nr:MBL fold metallo-hydrolase [Lachnospiraceae bacterium]
MKDFRRVPTIKDPYDYIDNHPWDIAQAPFRIAPHVWYVSGNSYVGCYLLDTGEGLILIDTFEIRALYLLTEAIRDAGFNPKDIKMILLSHGHQDHCGGLRAMQELTKAKVYMSKEDYVIKKEHPDRVLFHFAPDFEPDAFFDDNEPITMGRFTIRTKLCPGHTPGTTSFFFDDVDEDGTVYHCGMHGGAGTPFLMKRFLTEYGYPLTLKQRFIDDCREMANWDIDICLTSHHNMTNLLSGVNPDDPTDFSAFVDKSVWREFMLERAADAEKLD